MKRFKNLLVVPICFILFICQFSIVTEASVGNAFDRLGEIIDGSLLTNDSSAEGQFHSLARGTYLAGGNCRISIATSGIRIAGETYCNRMSDSVQVNVTLERQVGNTWNSVLTRGELGYNTTEAMCNEVVYAPGGYFYRVKGTHIAKKGSITETGTSYSNSIYIN